MPLLADNLAPVIGVNLELDDDSIFAGRLGDSNCFRVIYDDFGDVLDEFLHLVFSAANLSIIPAFLSKLVAVSVG